MRDKLTLIRGTKEQIGGNFMSKAAALFITVVFLLGVAVSPVIAGGDKVQGDQAVSGNFGGDQAKGKAPGPDKEGNQV